MLPEFALPVMDALQQLGHTPVTLSMSSMSEMYRDLRLNKKGGYELFLFHAKDVVRKGRLDFALSFGLSGILEDVVKSELHYLPEEFELNGLLYLHSKSMDVVQRLLEAGAANWKHTIIACSTASLVKRMCDEGIDARHLPLAYSPRLFYPHYRVPDNAAYPLQMDDERLAGGYTVSFAGSSNDQRAAWLRPVLDAGVPLAVFGDQGWLKLGFERAYRGSLNRLTELNTVYNASQVNLALPNAAAAEEEQPDYVSPRVVECLACGAFMLSLEQPGLEHYVAPGAEIAVCSPSDLADSVTKWLNDSAGRAVLSHAGLARVQEEAQWTQRLTSALGWLELATVRSAVH
jgi:hypothetical protein